MQADDTRKDGTMSNTPNLSLPYIMAAQAQKHVTHNDAVRALDAVVQLAVLDSGLATPPVSPTEGDRYIIAGGATGVWSGKDAQIAAWQDGAWMFYAPREGWLAWVADEDTLFAWDGSAWSGVSTQTAEQFGINTAADPINRLSVKADAALFSHDDVTPGSGDMRAKLNKSAAAKTASFLFQDNSSGRAEIGLTGDDDLHFKVSSDGTSFREAILIDRTAGSVAFPHTADVGYNYLINGDFSINQRGFAGGALAAGDYGYDRWKADTGGANTSVSGETVTLTGGTLVQVIEAPLLAGAQVTVSIEDLSGGGLDIDVEGQTGTISAASGRQGASLTVPPGSTGDVTVKLAPTSGAVTFRRVRLERGTAHSGWAYRHLSTELTLCRRYFERLSGAPGDRYIRRGVTGVTGPHYFPIQFFGQKRAAPTVTLLNLSYSNASNGQAFNPSFYEFEFYLNVTSSAGFAFFGYEADAEL